MPIQHISDTARWVAAYRAMESARKDALFQDPFAARLAGAEGPEIIGELKRGKSLAWPMIVRTAVFDEMITDRIKESGIDTIVNLAAGLDTRAWRMTLPVSLQWIDVDLPGITAYKANAMRGDRPRCNYRTVAVDLTDASARDGLFAEIDATSKAALVMSEGLLVYLSAADVGNLALAIHTMKCAQYWMFDLAGARLLPIMNKNWGRALAQAGSPFQFAPAEGTAFFEKFGWRELEFRSGLGEAHRLHREMRMAPVWRFLAHFGSAERREEYRRISGYVMLQRANQKSSPTPL